MQWLWSWLLLEALMALHAHKVIAVLLPHVTSHSLVADAHQVALAGPTSLHVIARVASSLVGQLRMMAGLLTLVRTPLPCVHFTRRCLAFISRVHFLGAEWGPIVKVFQAHAHT
jgi:hypothetical protein